MKPIVKICISIILICLLVISCQTTTHNQITVRGTVYEKIENPPALYDGSPANAANLIDSYLLMSVKLDDGTIFYMPIDPIEFRSYEPGSIIVTTVDETVVYPERIDKYKYFNIVFIFLSIITLCWALCNILFLNNIDTTDQKWLSRGSIKNGYLVDQSEIILTAKLGQKEKP